jgi:hypothetical protein
MVLCWKNAARRRRGMLIDNALGLASQGGGASSLARLRKVLLIRAYNSRPKDQTVSEQFAQFRRVNAQGDAVLTREVRGSRLTG